MERRSARPSSQLRSASKSGLFVSASHFSVFNPSRVSKGLANTWLKRMVRRRAAVESLLNGLGAGEDEANGVAEACVADERIEDAVWVVDAAIFLLACCEMERRNDVCLGSDRPTRPLSGCSQGAADDAICFRQFPQMQ